MAEMHEHSELTPLAAFLHQAIDASRKPQGELAKEIGFRSVNYLSMVKHGKAKLPIEKVIPTAMALNVDRAHLCRLVLEQDMPRQLHVIEDIFGLVVSHNEKRFVLMVREITHNADPAFSRGEIEKMIAESLRKDAAKVVPRHRARSKRRRSR